MDQVDKLLLYTFIGVLLIVILSFFVESPKYPEEDHSPNFSERHYIVPGVIYYPPSKPKYYNEPDVKSGHEDNYEKSGHDPMLYDVIELKDVN